MLSAADAYAALTLTASGADVRVQWSRSLNGGPITSFDAQLSGPGVTSTASRGDETVTLGSGTHTFRFKECASYYNGTPQCTTTTRSTTITGVGVRPSSVTLAPGTLSCDDDDGISISWTQVPAARYAVETRDRASGGSWGSWSRIRNDFAGLNTQVAQFNSGREYQFRVSARARSEGSEYLSWRESSVLAVPDCTPAPVTTPFVAEPSMVSSHEIAETDATGATTGEFRVSETGAATYRIPIALAAGTAGVAPELAIVYSSQGGNGLLGRGWDLSGLSSISRCRQTLMQDRKALSITWGADDRFCLNGSRLLLVEGSTYGAPGSQYRTELDSFVTVTAVGGTTGRPDYFEMTAKDGSTTRFGGAGNHSSETVGYTPGGSAQFDKVLTWNVSRFEDSVGNPINFNYSRSFSYHRISSIHFAYGNATTSGASVTFEYEGREDAIHNFVAGYKFSNTQRINRLVSKNGDDEIRRYELRYYPNSSVEGVAKSSRITQLKECIGSNCLPATTFNWHGYGSVGKDEDYDISVIGDLNSYDFADINGDGLLDPVWVVGNTIYYSIKGQRYSAAAPGYDDVTIKVLDYNLDGRDDLLVYAKNPSKRWRLLLSSPLAQTGGNGEVQWRLQSKSAITFPFTEKQMEFVDYNADGVVDAYSLDKSNRRLRIYPGERTGEPATSNTYYRFSRTFISVSIPGSGALDHDEFVWGDFNGDGKVDVVLSNRSNHGPANRYNIDLLLSNSAGTLEDVATLTTSNRSVSALRAIDINGDGLTDVAWLFSGGTWQYRINNGTTFEETKSISITGESLNDSNAQLVDINGDGYIDFYWTSGSYINYKAWQPKLNRFSATSSFWMDGSPQLPWGFNNGVSYSLRDIDNNGEVDLIGIASHATFSDGSKGLRVRHKASASSRFVTHIRDGRGAGTQIEYSPLNDLVKPGIYTTYEGIAVRADSVEVCTGGYAIPKTNGGYVPRTCRDETQYDVDAAEFYRQVNDPYANLPEGSQVLRPEEVAPVIELKGALPVVSAVYKSSPIVNDPDHKVGMDYRYKLNLMQAAGRGTLGFRELINKNLQTGMVTRSVYRQDWPFIGQPLSTVTLSEEGNKLSESLNSSQIFNWYAGMADDLHSDGSAALGPLQVFVANTVDVQYRLVDDGASQGYWHTRVETETEPDEYGNIVFSEALTVDNHHNQYIQTTQNTYGENDWYQQFGRLTRTVVNHKRMTPQWATVTTTNVVEFTYYPSSSGAKAGLLDAEISAVGDANLQLQTNHYYDDFGNPVFQTFVGADGVKRLSANKVYDARGRFVQSTYGPFNRDVSASDDAGSTGAYVAERDRLLGPYGATIQKTNEVTERDYLGLPTASRTYKGANTSVTSQSAYTPFGRQYFSAESSGAYTLKTAATGAGYHCSYETAFYTRQRVAGGGETVTCHDKLGREIRSGKVGFNGDWSFIDTEYDAAGRVARVSDPYQNSANGWTTFTYDLLGRTVLTVSSDSSESSTEYNGLIVTTTNDLGQTNTKIHTGSGELASVVNAANQGIYYLYTADGNPRTIFSNYSSAAHIEYDVAGNKIRMDDGDKGEWFYRYNSMGELVCQQNAEDQIVVNSYDFAGRQTMRTNRLSGGTCANPTGAVESTAAWEYDTASNGLGKLAVEWSGESGRTKLDPDYRKAPVYDSLGRLAVSLTMLRGHNNQLNYHWEQVSYDQFSRPWKTWDAARAGPDFTSNGVENLYDSSGYLYKVKDAHSTNVYYEVLAVDARGNVTEETLGAGVIRRSKRFDESTGRLGNIEAKDSINRQLQFSGFGWDSLGNLNARVEAGLNFNYDISARLETFHYDELNQLIEYSVSSASGSSSVTFIEYDERGNIAYKSDVGNYTYDSNGQNANAVQTAGSHSYVYNENGSLILDSRGRTFN